MDARRNKQQRIKEEGEWAPLCGPFLFSYLPTPPKALLFDLWSILPKSSLLLLSLIS
jgi:hypothetical protein